MLCLKGRWNCYVYSQWSYCFPCLIISCNKHLKGEASKFKTYFDIKKALSFQVWYISCCHAFISFLSSVDFICMHIVNCMTVFTFIFVLTLQSEHDGSDVQIELNVDHQYGEDLVPNMSRSPRVKYITYYEDSESLLGKRTAIWELDKGACMSAWLVLSCHGLTNKYYGYKDKLNSI